MREVAEHVHPGPNLELGKVQMGFLGALGMGPEEWC